MKVLIAQASSSEAAELKEYFQSNACEVFIATERVFVYQMLAQHSIDIVLYNVNYLDDFAVIRYINNTYPAVKVIVATDASFCANINNIRHSAFTSVQLPYHLDHLQELFTSESSIICPNQLNEKSNKQINKR